jgi:hypothetical protein
MDTLTVVHLETFEVSPMLQEVVSTITPLVAKNGNRLEVRCAEGLGGTAGQSREGAPGPFQPAQQRLQVYE